MDFTSVAQAALDLVERLMESRVTLLYCVDILRGANSTKIKNLGHDDLEEFGAAKHLPRGEVERLFYRLLMENALAELNVVNRANFVTQYLEVRHQYPFLKRHADFHSLDRTAMISGRDVVNSNYK
jgi:bloom syndrome protein